MPGRTGATAPQANRVCLAFGNIRVALWRMTFFASPPKRSLGRVMRATAKLAFLVAVMAMTASVNAWAQTHDRCVDAQPPAEKPGTPELPPGFTFNNNIPWYSYLPPPTNTRPR